MPAQTKSRFADLDSLPDINKKDIRVSGKNPYDFDIDCDDDIGMENDNDRDGEFNLELDIHKSTQNLKLEKALQYYQSSAEKDKILDTLTEDIIGALIGDEFKQENIKLVDSNFANS